MVNTAGDDLVRFYSRPLAGNPPMNHCRYCGKPGATIKTLAYWNQTPDICHPECKAAGERQEAIDCQVIDADCNDCIHFQRGQIIGGIPKAITGHCGKFNKPTMAYPHFWTGRECFEHRRLARNEKDNP